MRGLAKKRALITGGASGIGKATAVRFLDEGAQVIVLDRDQKAGEQIMQELPGLSAVIQADVSDPEAVGSAFDELDNLWGDWISWSTTPGSACGIHSSISNLRNGARLLT